MRTRILFAVLGLAVACFALPLAAEPPLAPPSTGGGTGGADAAAAKPVSDIQDVVFFGDTKPVLIRLHVQVDGKSYRDAYESFLKKLMTDLDSDKDGLLKGEEIARVPPPTVLFNAGYIGFQGGGVTDPKQIDVDGDGKVTREELAEFFRASAGDLFRLQFGQYGQANSTADAVTNALFTRLDANKDGKLSRAELKVTEALFGLDVDDDELVSLQELGGNVYGNQPFGGGQIVIRQPQPGGGTQPPANAAFLAISNNNVSRQIVNELLSRYCRDAKQEDLPLRKKKLTRAELGLSIEDFAQMDTTRDGFLDTDELENYAHRGADIEMIVRMGKLADKEPAAELVSGKRTPPLNSAVKVSSDGVSVVTIGNAQIELRRNEANAQGGRVLDVKQVYVQQFKLADTDNNGYIDKKEAMAPQAARGIGSLFKLADKDADGMLYEKELLEYVEKFAGYQRDAQTSRMFLTVTDRGAGLFDMLDANRDGKLSLRELRNAPANLLKLDGDKDDALARSEIPRNYQLQMSRGVAGYGNQVLFVVDGYNNPQPAPPPAKGAGPLWFNRMDRNRDGDISPREFLIGKEEFKKLDADGDGLISLEEAEKIDPRYQKK